MICGLGGSASAAKLFPRYYAITKNVAFWEKIYATYSLEQAVIHDSEDLSRVYEVIKLKSAKVSGAQSHNNKLQTQAKKKYRAILQKLTKHPPRSKEEKRIGAFFTGPNRQKKMARAAKNVRSQTGQRERFKKGVIASGAYMKEIKRIFRSYRLPAELSYLPHVESSFNPRAYSKFGAAGIWQFTRETGKRYLRIDSTLDERLDPILASHAAAKYLKNSYRSLGNWPMAITSYNYGLSGMLRAQKKHESYTEIFKNYNKGHFKFASKNFYSEWLAALSVAQRMEKKISLSPPQSSRQMKLKGYVSISDISRHFKTETKIIKGLNPALRPPVLLGEKLIPKGYSIRLPSGKSTSKLIASVPSSIYKKRQIPSRYHRVKKGETAGVIAQLHHIPLKSLMQANNLDKYATIYIRQKLRIPRSPTSAKRSAKVLTLTARPKGKTITAEKLSRLPILSESKKNRPTDKGYDFLPAKDPTVYNVYNQQKKNGLPIGQITVQPEESLGLYAEWLGTKRGVLEKFNGLKKSVAISPGQQLTLPFKTVSPHSFEEKRLDFLLETEEDFFSAYTVIGQRSYTVNSGDTLWDLCRNKFDIPLWLLERYNSTIDLARLQYQQELIVPVVKQL